MEKLTFVQLEKGNEEHYRLFESLMIPYNKELDEHKNRRTPKDFLLRWTHSVLDMQGAYDRHLELCYDNENLIGFLYGKVDHEDHKGFIKQGYGYIMEFYVKPEFRRKGYGRAMFKRLEEHFASNGAKRMYLTADPVTGKPFWEAQGFANTGVQSPENGQDIYEKEICYSDNLITITISRYLSPCLLQKIAAHQKPYEERTIHGLTNIISNYQWYTEHFSVIAKTQTDEVTGYAGFLQNQKNLKKWLYTDLWVNVDYRRKSIAKKLVNAGIEYLSDIGAKELYCTVDPNNYASINLQKALGFAEIPTEPFDEMFTDNLLMFRLNVPLNLSALPLKADNFYIGFICDLLVSKENESALHTKKVSDEGRKAFFQEMKKCLKSAENDSDEQNFIIQKGIVPVAWLKVNGLDSGMAWISMLVVHQKFKRQGVGTFTVKFAENFARSKGFSKMGIHTTDDNIAAQSLYRKCGYTITEDGDCTSGDGVSRKRYTFIKLL